MAKSKASAPKSTAPKPVCGIVMPISEREGCSAHHWNEVLEILNDAAQMAGYDGNLVSNAEHIGVIQQTIVENLYDNPVVICDVSTENPNVMFELGLRLAFDKPTVVVVDDKTKIQFDTSPIEHLKYPRDLRFASIVDFKRRLADKIKATVVKCSDPNFATFLRSFKRFRPAKIESQEISKEEFIVRELVEMRRTLESMRSYVAAEREMRLDRKRGQSPAAETADVIFGALPPLTQLELLAKAITMRTAGLSRMEIFDTLKLHANVDGEMAINAMKNAGINLRDI